MNMDKARTRAIGRIAVALPRFSEAFLSRLAERMEDLLAGKRPPQRTDGPSLRLTRGDGERPA